MRRAPDPETDLGIQYRNQAIILSLQGHFAQSESYAREALRLRPDDVDTMNELGVALWRQRARPRPRSFTIEPSRSSPTTGES